MKDVKELELALDKYTGNEPYLLLLKDKISKKENLSTTNFMLGKQIFYKTAAKLNDKELIPSREIKNLNLDFSKYSRVPFKHQVEGVNWLLQTPKGILGDEPGLGKSAEGALAAIYGGFKKVLIVCPAFLKLNWQAELGYFTIQDEISILTSKSFNIKKFNIINYDILKKYKKELLKEKFDLIIADEAHLLKNLQSIRTKQFISIANKTKNVWLLTGTPIANRPIDFYSLLKICKHELGKNKQLFGMRYCNGQANYFGGMDFSGASNLKELHFKTLDVILRRKKEDVLDLPEKIQTPILLELANFKKYENAVEDYYNKLYIEVNDPNSDLYGKDISQGSVLAELSCYRKFCALEKVKDGSLFELIDNQLSEFGRCVVFTGYHQTADLIQEHYKNNCGLIDGRIDPIEKQKRIDVFQSGKGPDILVCNINIAIGITLTNACIGIFNDLPWSPALLQQAIDRLHRISQTQKVNLLFPVYKNTIDEIMLNVLRDKIKNINEAVDGNAQISNFSGDITKEIFNMLKSLKSL